MGGIALIIGRVRLPITVGEVDQKGCNLARSQAVDPAEKVRMKMDKQTARAIWKSILRNHPFFKHSGYQAFGYDLRTMVACGYQRAADVLAYAITVAESQA